MTYWLNPSGPPTVSTDKRVSAVNGNGIGLKCGAMPCAVLCAIFVLLLLGISGCSTTEDRTIHPSKDVPSTGDSGTVIDVSANRGRTDDDFSSYVDLPKASENFVYVLNPTAGSVTLVNAQQYTIQVIDAGEKPTFIEIVEGTDDAIVLNTGSDDATIVRVNDEGIATATSLDVVHGANTLSISPDGQHMIVYFNAERQNLSSTFGDFQTVSLLSFADGTSTTTTMSVGFKPRDIFYKEDNSEAYVVTDDGVSILNFAEIAESGSGIAHNISFVSSNYSEDIEMFTITPDGKYAISRAWGTTSVNMVELATNAEYSLDLNGFFKVNYHTGETYWDGVLEFPTSFKQLDFVVEGMYALALEYNSKKLLKIPLPEGMLDPTLATMVDLTNFVSDTVVPIDNTGKALVYRGEKWSEQIGIVNWDVIQEGMDILFDASCNDDQFEDNDTPQTAIPIVPPLDEAAAICGDDDDYYQVALNANDTIEISLLFDGALGNIDLYVYDPAGVQYASSLSKSSDESLTLHVSEAGVYTIGATLVTPNVFKQNYQLIVDVISLDSGGDTETDTDTDTATDSVTDADTETAATDSDSQTDTAGGIEDAPFTILQLQKSVASVDVAQDGKTALITHTKAQGDPNDSWLSVEQRIDRSYGYSLLHPETGFIKMQLTEVAPNGMVAVPNSNTLFLIFWKPGSPPVKEVHRINLEKFVIDPVIKLESPPLSAGYIPGQNKIFVNQDHPEGRVTFIDVETSETQTVTGFELNNEIKD